MTWSRTQANAEFKQLMQQLAGFVTRPPDEHDDYLIWMSWNLIRRESNLAQCDEGPTDGVPFREGLGDIVLQVARYEGAEPPHIEIRSGDRLGEGVGTEYGVTRHYCIQAMGPGDKMLGEHVRSYDTMAELCLGVVALINSYIILSCAVPVAYAQAVS